MLAGCASRSYTKSHSFLSPIINLYNRNFIVAAPTRVGNYVCGSPFFFLSGGIDALFSYKAHSETYYGVINGIYILPANICGAITGTLFIPISYVCPENPWYEDFSTYYRETSCLPPKAESPFNKTKESDALLKSNLSSQPNSK
jgi:hypothetical protein